VADRPVEEDHLGAGVGELLEQEHLVGIAAGETIRGVDIEDVDRRQGR
jgi:hypothetical protein